jgi:hypothetical protein
LCRPPDVTQETVSPYRCSFCSDRLIRHHYRGWRRVWLLTPMREFKCPHCFSIFSKPIEFIGRLTQHTPTVNLTRVSRRIRKANDTASNRSERLQKKVFRALSRLGKRVTRIEEAAYAGVRRCLSLLNPRTRIRRHQRRRSRTRHREHSDE